MQYCLTLDLGSPWFWACLVPSAVILYFLVGSVLAGLGARFHVYDEPETAVVWAAFWPLVVVVGGGVVVLIVVVYGLSRPFVWITRAVAGRKDWEV